MSIHCDVQSFPRAIVALSAFLLLLAAASAPAQYDTLVRYVNPESHGFGFTLQHLTGDTVLLFSSMNVPDSITRVFRSFDQGESWDSVDISGSYFFGVGPSKSINIVGHHFSHGGPGRDVSKTLVYRGGTDVDTINSSSDDLERGHSPIEVRPHPSFDGFYFLVGRSPTIQSNYTQRLYIRTPLDEQWKLLPIPEPAIELGSEVAFQLDFNRPDRFWVQITSWGIDGKRVRDRWVTTDTGKTWMPYTHHLAAWVGVIAPNKGFAWVRDDDVTQPAVVDVVTGHVDTLDWTTRISNTLRSAFDLGDRRILVRSWGDGTYTNAATNGFIDPRATNRLMFHVSLLPDSSSRVHLGTLVATEDFGQTWHVITDLLPGFGADTSRGFGPLLLTNGTVVGFYSMSSTNLPGYKLHEFGILRRSTTLSINSIDSPSSFSVYPNPSSVDVTVDFNENHRVRSLAVYDISGAPVLEKRVSPHETSVLISVRDLASGYYVLRLRSDTSIQSKPLVVYQ